MYVTVPGLWIPANPPWNVISGFPSASSLIMDSSGDSVGVVFRAPKTGTLNGFGMKMGLKSGTNTPRASWQSVDASGLPDGSVDEFVLPTVTSNAWNDFSPLTNDGTGGGTKRSVTVGELIAAVLDFSAYTSGSYIANHWLVGSGPSSHPYSLFYNGSSWAKQTLVPSLAVAYNDGTYEVLGRDTLHAAVSLGMSSGFGNNTSPDEMGQKLTLPFNCKIDAISVLASVGGGDFDVVIYEGDSTTLLTDSIDADSQLTGNRWWFHRLSTPIELQADLSYRITLRPSSTSTIALAGTNFNTAAHRGGHDGGTSFNYCDRVDAGSWSELTTNIVFLQIRISEIAVTPESIIQLSDPTGLSGGLAW